MYRVIPKQVIWRDGWVWLGLVSEEDGSMIFEKDVEDGCSDKGGSGRKHVQRCVIPTG
jgi:hypothetical protein